MASDRDQIETYFSWDPQENREFSHLIHGSGPIGGKGRSLLFALKVLRDAGDPDLDAVHLPPSIFISVQGFREFLARVPGLDELVAGEPEQLEEAFLKVPLSEFIVDAVRAFIREMHDPIVVRSSSMLEDSLKHSFAGKYRSTFLMNGDGPLEERVTAAVQEIKRIYARIFFPAATSYRGKHNLPADEMGIIVMRMSGQWRGRYYYPTTGGLAFSRNYRRWTTRIRGEDGVIRLVFGLGTMSTKRGYARTYSLTNPFLRPEGLDPFKVMRHAQEHFAAVDRVTQDLEVINIQRTWRDIMPYHEKFRDYAQVYNEDCEGGYFSNMNKAFMEDRSVKICFTFENFPRSRRCFFERMKKMLPRLEEAMGVPADVEFAYDPDSDYLELLQSRPLWISERGDDQKLPDLTDKEVLLQANKMVTDGVAEHVPYLVYIDHRVYSASSDFHEIARAIGCVNKQLEGKGYILAAPGRVGSSNPELGVPVHYNELTNCRCIVEIGIPKAGYMPELSYGTHFFSDLEVDNILYMPVYDGETGNIYRKTFFDDPMLPPGPHPAIRVIPGNFSVFMDGNRNIGVVIRNTDD